MKLFLSILTLALVTNYLSSSGFFFFLRCSNFWCCNFCIF